MDFVKNNQSILIAGVLIFLIFVMNQRYCNRNVVASRENGCSKNELVDRSRVEATIPVTLLQLYQNDDSSIAKFIGTCKGMPNKLLLQNGDDIASKMGLDSTKATYSSVAFDFDKTGYNDLIVSMEDGVWLFKNNLIAGKPFSSKLIMAKQLGQTPITIGVNDFDKNGNTDLFIRQINDSSVKVKSNKDSADGYGSSVILRYVGQYEFVDVTSIVAETKLNVLERCSSLSIYRSDLPTGNDIIIKLPNTLEFSNARVVVVSGETNLIKFNLVGSGLVQNSTLLFNLGSNSYIDKVKIRTMYGKEYNYAEQKINTILKVEPSPHFENRFL